MCKEKTTFTSLSSIDCKEHIEKKNGLSYLSWAWAWQYVKSNYPDASYRIRNWDDKPYLYDENLGFYVETSVTIGGETLTMWLPVMDNANKAMKLQPYTYQTYDKYKKQYVDKTVASATMFDINTAIMRCLVKNLAMFGLGLYIYAGEDLPQDVTMDEVIEPEIIEPEPKVKPTPKKPEPKVVNVEATDNSLEIILRSLDGCKSQADLNNLWFKLGDEQHNTKEIKEAFTARKNEILNASK